MHDAEFDLPKPPGFDDDTEHHQRRRKVGRVFVVLLLLAGLAAVGLEAFPELLGNGNKPGFFDDLFNKFGRMRQPNPMRLINRCQAHLHAGKYNLALRDADLLIEMKELAAGHFLRGEALGRMGKFAESIADYDRALAVQPDWPIALNNRAYNCALARVAIPQAMEDVEKALRMEQWNPAYVDTRGYLHYLLGNHKRALADFNSILDQPLAARFEEQGLGEIYFHRGLTHRQLGDEELAQADFKQAEQHGYQIAEYPLPLAQDGSKKK